MREINYNGKEKYILKNYNRTWKSSEHKMRPAFIQSWETKALLESRECLCVCLSVCLFPHSHLWCFQFSLLPHYERKSVSLFFFSIFDF